MISRLKNNTVFQWLVPLLSLAAIGVMQYFLYNAYIVWTVWQMVLLEVLSGLCIVAFSFWVAINLVKDRDLKSVVLGTLIPSVILCVLYFAAPAIIIYVKNNSFAAILFGMIVTDALLIGDFVFTLATGIITIGKKQVFGMLAIVMCAVIVCMSVYVGRLPVSSDNVIAVQDFSICDCLPDGKGEKVKVVLLAGQSNASGVCRVPYLQQQVSEEKFAEYTDGYANVLINYFDDNGLNTSSGAFVRTSVNQGYSKDGFFGPELGMAEVLSAEYSTEKVIILKYAWGGSVLGTQWYAPKDGKEGGPLYTAFINFVSTYMDYLAKRNYDADIGAMCWMQGESDSGYNLAPLYLTNTKDFVASVRSDLARYSDNGIYFIDAGISDSKYWVNYKTINQAKKDFADTSDKNIYIDTSDLSYKNEPTGSPDLAHYDALSGITLGNRFANAIIECYNK